MSIEGPSKVEINCVDNEDGTCSVDYVPTEGGQYLINVTYADVHVPGSPFKCSIGDGRVPVDEEITAITDDGVQSAPDFGGETSDMLAFPSSKARSPQDFVIKFSGSGDLKASVTRPSGIEDDAEVVETDTDTYTVRFVPRETGEHLVNVKSRRRHIPGSPFKVLVEAPAGGAAACKAHGPGLEGGVAGQPCRFTVITRDAGPGGLAVAVEGPAKAEIQCHDNGDGSCDITWYPIDSGEYTVHIRFADEAIPGSPYKVGILKHVVFYLLNPEIKFLRNVLYLFTNATLNFCKNSFLLCTNLECLFFFLRSTISTTIILILLVDRKNLFPRILKKKHEN